MDALLRAIWNDDRARASALLRADRSLATRLIDEARLYEGRIFHWIYAGDTALHLAAGGYRVEIGRALLAAGADPNSAANHRRSGPLHYAADGYVSGPAWDAQRQVKTIRCLLDAGADLQAQDKNGATPLHRAVRTRCADAVECLLAAGSDPTRKNKSGSTPFHLAVQDTGRGGAGSDQARAGQRQIVQLFLAIGVSTGLKDGRGKTVLDCARSPAVQAMLRGD
ncbi:MAG TPA: ankyrin repeat domain-containing protein [Pirellulaceae bacterium]|nr:ankyrin repeat domain-containing protein [Pirellulaceae bacterium]